MLRGLTQIFWKRDSPNVLVECRHCGSKLDDEADSCPECGSEEFATYQL
ncbi:zinc-ribbon domain-containing protein [Halorussus ruber]|nr:zinc-ribbon domain-containing protein [Halorussus ruber]